MRQFFINTAEHTDAPASRLFVPLGETLRGHWISPSDLPSASIGADVPRRIDVESSPTGCAIVIDESRLEDLTPQRPGRSLGVLLVVATVPVPFIHGGDPGEPPGRQAVRRNVVIDHI